jgi:hypothetical protein
MGFCPVCGMVGEAISARCERVAFYYGYSRSDLEKLSLLESSIAVPFFDIKRFFFALESLAQHPLARSMLDVVEHAAADIAVQEFGNAVRVLPFHDPAFPQFAELYVKDDVSKTMVVYQHEDAIEHVGSEERAVLFAEVAQRYFGLADMVPAAVCGLSPAGTKFVASAGLPKNEFVSLHDRLPNDLRALWNNGLLSRLTLMDFVLGQNDRNPQNILFSNDANPRVGLIDNDDAFVKHERLVAPFSYLTALPEGGAGLSLAIVQPWFDQFRLANLISLLSPLALPEDTVLAVCRRFVFAKHAVDSAMTVPQFMQAIFVERPVLTWNLEPCPWVVCRTLVSEGKGGTRYRTFVGEKIRNSFELVVLEGQLLDLKVAITNLSGGTLLSAEDADDAATALVAAAMADGFVHVMRRRFFVATAEIEDLLTDTVRIVEVRSDPAGFHVIVKRGGLGRYGTRQVDTYLSFEHSEQALARANELEAALLAANFIDLRGRLESFKAPAPLVLF